MQDAWRAYLEMALGLTEAPRKKAQKVATELLTKGGATAGQLQGLVEDLMSTGVANREALTNIVRYEVDRALGKVGLATADEVSELTSRVRDLEKQLRAAQARAGAAGPVAGDAAADLTIAEPGPAAVVPPATKTAVKKAVAKKAAKTATPNAMPAAATTAPPARAPKKTGAAKKVTPATTGPARDAPEKAVPAKATKAAKKAAATSTEPAGTAASPTAPVKAAAAQTALPPAKKTAARKSTPAKKAAGPETSTPEASA